MKVKIFSDVDRAEKTFSGKVKKQAFSDLESTINDWLSANPAIKIHKIEQMVSGGTFLGETEKLIITIFYEE